MREFHGVVIKYTNERYEIKKQFEDNVYSIIVSAGMVNAKLASILLENSISGFEFASGIPGTIGGAIYMNAGAFNSEMKDIVKDVTYIEPETLKIKTIYNKECDFSYRYSIFQRKEYQKLIILKTELILKEGKKEEIKEKMDEYREKRLKTQPLEYPSAGSTFKRGDGFITAELIDKAGLKGYKIGGAEVSKKHAGFIINSQNATAKDILDLIKYVEDKVYEKYNVKIKLEVRILE